MKLDRDRKDVLSRQQKMLFGLAGVPLMVSARGRGPDLVSGQGWQGARLSEVVTTAAAPVDGRLSPKGDVRVSWTLESKQVELVWQESGGPAVVPPARTGFGSRLLDGGAQQLHGTVRMTYLPEGLICRLCFAVKTPDLACLAARRSAASTSMANVAPARLAPVARCLRPACASPRRPGGMPFPSVFGWSGALRRRDCDAAALVLAVLAVAVVWTAVTPSSSARPVTAFPSYGLHFQDEAASIATAGTIVRFLPDNPIRSVCVQGS